MIRRTNETNQKMNDNKYARLSIKDKKKIDNIIEKGKKQPREKCFTPHFIYRHLDESFKDWSYDTLHDQLDMLESLVWLANKLGIAPRSDIKYIIEHHVGYDLESATKPEINRFKRLTKRWGITIKMLKSILEKEQFEVLK